MDTNSKNFKRIAPLFVISGAILWGLQGIFVNVLSSYGLDSQQCAVLRVTTAAVIMMIFMAIAMPKELKVKLRHIPLFMCAGILGTLCTSLFYFKSIILNGLTTASILLYVEPAILMILSAILFKDKITKIKTISLTMAFIGCVFVCGIGTQTAISPQGIGFGLLSALSYALYSVFSVYLFKRGYSSFTVTAYAMLFAGIGSLFVTDLGELANVCLESSNTIYPAAVLTGIATAILPYTLYTTGLKGTKPGNAAIMAYIEPLTATVAGILIYSEKPTYLTFLGIVLIVLSVVILNVKKNKKA